MPSDIILPVLSSRLIIDARHLQLVTAFLILYVKFGRSEFCKLNETSVIPGSLVALAETMISVKTCAKTR